MSNHLLNITVSIADRPYRLKIDKEEEQKVRNAAKELNNKITEYQQSYHANDKWDYLAMAALLYTSEFMELKHAHKHHQQFHTDVFDTIEESLTELEELLSYTM